MRIGNPAFCLTLYLTRVHFRGELQHLGDVSKQKIKCRPVRLSEKLYAYVEPLIYEMLKFLLILLILSWVT